MITATLDTNVLASGIVTYGKSTSPAQILRAWKSGEFQLVTSEHILEELKHTLETPYFKRYISSQQVAGTINLFQEEAIVIPIIQNVRGIATHLEDDLIIATALSAKSDYLVTGDKPFLTRVGPTYQGMKIINPNDFIKKLHVSK
ncbi:MAG: putative toxin-antitoxin system toxin component, PIN family [bacterium]|nr:putative toxin-antitoxin system toxin component, PIN family [bacterium]